MSKRSLNVVIPTLRKDIIIGENKYGSELWFDFNPEFEDDQIYQMFVAKEPPQDSVTQMVNWHDNPWFPEVLRRDREDLMRRDPDEAAHIYDGTLRQTVEGAIYKRELLTAEVENRITRVPYDAQKPVFTLWDIGPAHTAIWFAQSFPYEFHVIDYLQGELQSLAYYMKALQEKPYTYGGHTLPWDAESPDYSGRSVKKQMQGVFGDNRVRCAAQLKINDGIAAARTIFAKCIIDRERCAEGLRALRCYQYEYDKELRTYKRIPLHDWASHPADAFRTLAVSIQDLGSEKKQEAVAVRVGPRAWGASDGAWME
jgi:phage terminase large subunit